LEKNCGYGFGYSRGFFRIRIAATAVDIPSGPAIRCCLGSTQENWLDYDSFQCTGQLLGLFRCRIPVQSAPQIVPTDGDFQEAMGQCPDVVELARSSASSPHQTRSPRASRIGGCLLPGYGREVLQQFLRSFIEPLLVFLRLFAWVQSYVGQHLSKRASLQQGHTYQGRKSRC
jgi:hypothetical protein